MANFHTFFPLFISISSLIFNKFDDRSRTIGSNWIYFFSVTRYDDRRVSLFCVARSVQLFFLDSKLIGCLLFVCMTIPLQ